MQSEYAELYRAPKDPVTDVELLATTYPYGRGKPGHGVQINLRKGMAYLVTRLPERDAQALALAILGSYAALRDVHDG